VWRYKAFGVTRRLALQGVWRYKAFGAHSFNYSTASALINTASALTPTIG
ncbi:hypothetical protein I6942_07860, partial [Helicobacter pylori]|nr:hypothetical protein [Helicobacter pylori]MBH0299880.1 hypothetical protein [Helicobacter pylori]